MLVCSNYRYKTKRLRTEQGSHHSSSSLRKLPGVLMGRDLKHEKDMQLSSLAARGLLSSLPGTGMMNDHYHSTISAALSAAMMNAAAANSLPPPTSLFNNPSSSSIAAAVANLNQSAAMAAMQPTQRSPSTTPLNSTNNTTPPTNLNSFALNGLDQAMNYQLQHPSPYIQW